MWTYIHALVYRVVRSMVLNNAVNYWDEVGNIKGG
jgi:hypothetical protein